MKTQAWGWLAAGVLAAGLNASYHDGGLEWAHRIASRVEHNTAAVLALASGRADRFLAETRLAAAQSEGSSCPFSRALAQVQAKIDGSESEFDRVQVMSDRAQAISDRAQAMSDREQAAQDRWEARQVRIQNALAAKATHLQLRMVDFAPPDMRVMKGWRCPRVRVELPQLPALKGPAVVIHLDGIGAGPA